MKRYLILTSLFIFKFSFAGVTGISGGGATARPTNDLGRINSDSRVLAVADRARKGEVARAMKDADIAYQIGQRGDIVKFQVGKTLDNGKWDVKAIQGPARELTPNLNDALKKSFDSKQWQKINKEMLETGGG